MVGWGERRPARSGFWIWSMTVPFLFLLGLSDDILSGGG